MKKAAIYARVSTPDQHLEAQLYDLRDLAAKRDYTVIREFEDRGVSGSKSKRAGLDAMLSSARRREFDVLLVAAFDRIARSTKNFLEIVDELNELGIEFVSAREAIDTSGPMGRMFITLVGSIAELERSLIAAQPRRISWSSLSPLSMRLAWPCCPRVSLKFAPVRTIRLSTGTTIFESDLSPLPAKTDAPHPPAQRLEIQIDPRPGQLEKAGHRSGVLLVRPSIP